MSIDAPAASPGRVRPPEWFIEEMKRLRAEGLSKEAVAREMGVSRTMVTRWADPDGRERIHEKQVRYTRRRRAEQRALKEREREQAIKQAVRKAGAATAEAWQMAERMQDVLGQAQRETEDREVRRALSQAGVHYRKMRDEIVRALGVT